MASFVVLEPEGREPERMSTVYVRDGFHFWAFLQTVFWLLSKRLWWAALTAFLATVLFGVMGTYLGNELVPSLLTVLLGIYLGIEAPSLQLWSLRQRGYVEVAVIEADNFEEAEMRYLHALLPDVALPNMQPTNSPVFGRPAAPSSQFGLMPYPGAA